MSWAAVVIEDRRVHAPLPRPGQGSRSGRGCDHFRTDISHLPDLTGYLDDLLRTRERLAAAVEAVDEWARALFGLVASDPVVSRLVARLAADAPAAALRAIRSARAAARSGPGTWRGTPRLAQMVR